MQAPEPPWSRDWRCAGGAAVPVRYEADLVLRGGRVLVMNEAADRAEALAVRDGNIVAVGSAAEIERWLGQNTRVIELHGRAVLPGINDSHLHACWLGARWPHTFFGAEDAAAAEQISGTLLNDRAARRAAILRAGTLLTELGITSYTEPGIGPGEDEGETGCFHNEVLEVYRELAAAGELQQRVTLLALYGIIDGPSELGTVLAGIEQRREADAEPCPRWLNIPGVKIFGDLIPLTRQAWSSHAYNDGSHGGLLVDGDTLDQQSRNLAEMVRAVHRAGLQLGVHATGDRTIQLVIDAITEAAAEPGAADPRTLGHVLIHGDLANRQQMERLAELGMWLNAQSGIAAHGSEWLATMMAEQVAAAAWDYGAALDAGVLVLSSDAPVLGFDWRQGIADAEARIVLMGGDTSPAAADKRLHRLLRAYTAVPAAQDGAAAWKGTIEAGKVADLTVLTCDPFEVGAAALPTVDVDLTVLDGRVVFERSR